MPMHLLSKLLFMSGHTSTVLCMSTKMNINHFRNTYITQSFPSLKSRMNNIWPCKDPSAVNYAVDMLASGEIIALPTDTVYGLACRADNSQALQNIYNVKGRNETKPVAICVGWVSDLRKYAECEHLPDSLLNTLLPGPVTLILHKSKFLDNPFLNPGVDKIGIRIPNHKFIRSIVQSCDFPLALTSANLSNEQSSLNITEFSEIWKKLAAIFDGGNLSTDTTKRAGSTIIDLSEEGYFKITREGIALQETTEHLHRFGMKRKVI